MRRSSRCVRGSRLSDYLQKLSVRALFLAQASATHASTGYALRRFNTDVSQGAHRVTDLACTSLTRGLFLGFTEEFDTELEKLNVSLVSENQALQQENRHLSALLKDYESTLEAIMAKFRAHAVRASPSSQQRPAY